MLKITQQYLVELVAERWFLTYFRENRWAIMANGVSAEVKYDLLCKAKTAAQIDAIIGNASWTNNFCGECNQYRPEAIVFGHGESTTICPECLTKASFL